MIAEYGSNETWARARACHADAPNNDSLSPPSLSLLYHFLPLSLSFQISVSETLLQFLFPPFFQIQQRPMFCPDLVHLKPSLHLLFNLLDTVSAALKQCEVRGGLMGFIWVRMG